MSIDFHPFVNSMNRTINDMAGVPVLNGPFEKKAGNEELGDITVKVKLSGDADVEVILTASSDAAVALTGLITGQNNLDSNESIVSDTVGEILNMLVGSAQRHANFFFDFSTPRLVAADKGNLADVYDSDYKRVVSKVTGENIGLYLISDVVA